jgi:glutathione S-transferase
MKLYYFPDSAALAVHVALHEAQLSFVVEKADIFSKQTETGGDYLAVNPKGTVPAIVLDDGTLVTESVAILDWIAGTNAALRPAEEGARRRQLELLAFLASELHKPFAFSFFVPGDEAGATIRAFIESRLALLSGMLDGDFLMGETFAVPDALAYVLLRWATRSGYDLTPDLTAYRNRIEARPAVSLALAEQGIAPVGPALESAV